MSTYFYKVSNIVWPEDLFELNTILNNKECNYLYIGFDSDESENVCSLDIMTDFEGLHKVEEFTNSDNNKKTGMQIAFRYAIDFDLFDSSLYDRDEMDSVFRNALDDIEEFVQQQQQQGEINV